MKYGKLTFFRDVEMTRFELITNKRPEPIAMWRCDCGREKRIRVRDVINGYSRSCGCANQSAMRGKINSLAKELTAKKKARMAR